MRTMGRDGLGGWDYRCKPQMLHRMDKWQSPTVQHREQYSISLIHMEKNMKKNDICRTSLVVQWARIRIHLPMQGTQVRFLVWEDPTWHRVTKPKGHSFWVCSLELLCHNSWACVLQVLKSARPGARAPQQEKPPQREARTPQLESSPCSPQLEKARAQQRRPSTAKINT